MDGFYIRGILIQSGKRKNAPISRPKPMTDYTSDPVHDEDCHMAALEAEEAANERMAIDYLAEYASETQWVFARNFKASYPGPAGEWKQVRVMCQDFDDFGVSLTETDREKLADLIGAYQLEKAGDFIRDKFIAYMMDIGLRAVRERKE